MPCVFRFFEMGFKLITALLTIPHDLIYSENNSIAQLFLNKTNEYPNVVTELFFRAIKLFLLLYILLKFIDFKSIIPNLKNKILFTTKNNRVFKQLGKALVIFSIVLFILKVVERIFKSPIEHKLDAVYIINIIIESFVKRMPLVIMGLFLLIIAKLINEGFELKEENELTI